MDLRTPGERDQCTPVNRHTTRGFPWVMDFLLFLAGLGGRIIYIPWLDRFAAEAESSVKIK